MLNPSEAIELIDRSGVVMIKWSTQPGVSALYISDNISQFGYEPNDFYNGKFKDYWNFVHEEDRDRVIKELYSSRSGVAKEDTTCVLTYRIRCKNGEVRWVEESLIHDRDENGKIRERGFLRDVTNAESIINKMRNSVEKYNYIFENTKQLIFTIDKKDIIVSANPAFQSLTGLKEGDKVRALIATGENTVYDKLGNYYRDYNELELKCNDEDIVFEAVSCLMTSGELLVMAQNVDEIKALRQKDKFHNTRDFVSGLYNHQMMNEFIKSGENEGYRVVMLKIADYKELVQQMGYDKVDEVVQKIAGALVDNFSMYNEKIYRGFDDEFLIFTRSPINNIHIQRTNRRLKGLVDLEWGVSGRNGDFPNLISEARANLKSYKASTEFGSIFGNNII